MGARDSLWLTLLVKLTSEKIFELESFIVLCFEDTHLFLHVKYIHVIEVIHRIFNLCCHKECIYKYVATF